MTELDDAWKEFLGDPEKAKEWREFQREQWRQLNSDKPPKRRKKRGKRSN